MISGHASPCCWRTRTGSVSWSASTSTRPRRRLHRASFHLVAPDDHDRTVETIIAFDPHVVVHISVWEPHSRANPATARQLTDDAATSILGAAAECRALESVIVRSGIEVYGRARGAPTRPDESADVDPTCDYGEMLAGIEKTAAAIGRRVGVSVGSIRMGNRARSARAQSVGPRAADAGRALQRARRPPVRRRRGRRRRQSLRRSRPPAAGRAGERGGQRRHHRAAGRPAGAPHPGAAGRARTGSWPRSSADCSARRSPTTSSS